MRPSAVPMVSQNDISKDDVPNNLVDFFGKQNQGDNVNAIQVDDIELQDVEK